MTRERRATLDRQLCELGFIGSASQSDTYFAQVVRRDGVEDEPRVPESPR